jgi:hypothetical protein
LANDVIVVLIVAVGPGLEHFEFGLLDAGAGSTIELGNHHAKFQEWPICKEDLKALSLKPEALSLKPEANGQQFLRLLLGNVLGRGSGMRVA